MEDCKDGKRDRPLGGGARKGPCRLQVEETHGPRQKMPLRPRTPWENCWPDIVPVRQLDERRRGRKPHRFRWTTSYVPYEEKTPPATAKRRLGG